MSNIEKYRKRFYTLIESEIGNVKPLINESAKLGDISAEAYDNNIKFVKQNKTYVYKLETSLGIDVDVLDLYQSSDGGYKMRIDAFGIDETVKDLDKDKLQGIISQIPKSKILFTTKDGNDMVLTLQ